MAANLKKLHARMESEHERLAKELDELRVHIRPTEERREGSPFGKREEEAEESFELEKQLAREKQVSEHLTELEHALSKFDQGTYGLCDNCGQPIDPARLEILPQASLCVSCKEKYAKGNPPRPG